MTTTPGYTVESLLRLARDLDRIPRSEHDAVIISAALMFQRIAAELTQVTAQSVERASPAKDGGERAVVWQARRKGGDDEPWWDIDQGTFEGGVIGAAHGAFEYRELFAAQPLASQMRPQSAGQGWVLVPVEPTEKMLTASYYPDCKSAKRREIYQAMLAAAPKLPRCQLTVRQSAQGEPVAWFPHYWQKEFTDRETCTANADKQSDDDVPLYLASPATPQDSIPAAKDGGQSQP